MTLLCTSRLSSALRIFYSYVSSAATVRCIANNSRLLIQAREISFSLVRPVGGTQNEGEPKKKKTVRVPEITLLQPDKTKIVTTLDVAQKLAKRRNLILTKVGEDPGVNRAIYSLGSSVDYMAKTEPAKKQDQHKSSKLIPIKAKIQKADLQVKCKQIQRLVSKGHLVKIAILSEATVTEDMAKPILNAITEHVKGIGKCVVPGEKGLHRISVHPIVRDDLSESTEPAQGKTEQKEDDVKSK